LEELLTNAIYHGYRVHGGEEKYRRRSVVTLLTDELVSLSYARGESGLYLRVCDQAGTLGFSEVAESLRRCYESLPQVQQKEGGAGLGTYMVFDAITHIKFECIHGKSTTISCWLADHKTFQPDVFSFNFFEKGPEE
jgi:anti-sigma regulatory factor (Ser/Thr protein kinase)